MFCKILCDAGHGQWAAGRLWRENHSSLHPASLLSLTLSEQCTTSYVWCTALYCKACSSLWDSAHCWLMITLKKHWLSHGVFQVSVVNVVQLTGLPKHGPTENQGASLQYLKSEMELNLCLCCTVDPFSHYCIVRNHFCQLLYNWHLFMINSIKLLVLCFLKH